MSSIERLTITIPTDMAAVVKAAVDGGDYASTSEAVREWTLRRVVQEQELAALKADIDKGLADVAAGRVRDSDTANIVKRGRQLSAKR